MFYKVVKNINYNGYGEKDLFRQIDFAVLSRTKDQYNFKVFYRNVAGKLVYFIYGKYRCAFLLGFGVSPTSKASCRRRRSGDWDIRKGYPNPLIALFVGTFQ